ncbi:MAG TPA: TonB-dependent receptor plug domain-containing protein, partial [Paludibacteraceae bacterium]|nr:TonB-dependent receptor plug domain-containing protein [Paludibacteraceae bacterium]
MSFRSFFSFVCIFSSLLSAKAQEQADSTLTGEEIDEVVVTGNNTVTRTSAPVRIITTHQKERLGITDISDALKRTAGVDVKDYGGVGGLKTVSVRGLGSQHT